MLEIVTKADCPVCDKTKTLLNQKNVLFTETRIGRDIVREDVLKKYPGVKQVPIIIYNGIKLGGFPELLNMIDRGQL